MKNHAQKIKPEILDILTSLECEGSVAKKYEGQLDRKQYQAFDEVMVALGGKWNRSKKGHVFPSDAQAIINKAVETGEFTDAKKAFELFETPESLADLLVERAGLESTDLVLEPSAGNGRIVQAILKAGAICQPIEINEVHRATLQKIVGDEADVIIGDFLQMTPQPLYQKIIMNPPFSHNQDVDHVRHAFKFLDNNEDGVEECKLVSIMSPHWTFANDRKSQEFRNWAADVGAWWEELPEGSFKSSGTNVRTILFEAVKE